MTNEREHLVERLWLPRRGEVQKSQITWRR